MTGQVCLIVLSLTFFFDTRIGSYHIYARKEGDPSAPRPQSVLKNWWDAYPRVKSSPESVSDEEVVALIRSPDSDPKDFAVIDVRRNDHAVRLSESSPWVVVY